MQKSKTMRKVERGSGNVFADLDLPNPEERLVKSELVRRISLTIQEMGLVQREAAELLGIDQPKVSALLNGNLSGFTVSRLVRFLNALGHDVDIVVKARNRAKQRGHVKVQAA